MTRRLERAEGRLGALPVDTLLDLRDGLERLLAGDDIGEEALGSLLDVAGI